MSRSSKARTRPCTPKANASRATVCEFVTWKIRPLPLLFLLSPASPCRYPAILTLAVDDKLELRIEDIAFGGEGVARVEDFVVFIPFVLVGDLVEAQISEIKKRFCGARL